MKTAAVINVRTSYNPDVNNAQHLPVLLQRKQYIYPTAVLPVSMPVPLSFNTWLSESKAQGFQRNRPFEHPAIIGTLRDEFFVGPNTIVNQYPDHFPRGQEHKHSLSLPMVALAATAVSGNDTHLINIYIPRYMHHSKNGRAAAICLLILRRMCMPTFTEVILKTFWI